MYDFISTQKWDLLYLSHPLVFEREAKNTKKKWATIRHISFISSLKQSVTYDIHQIIDFSLVIKSNRPRTERMGRQTRIYKHVISCWCNSFLMLMNTRAAFDKIERKAMGEEE